MVSRPISASGFLTFTIEAAGLTTKIRVIITLSFEKGTTVCVLLSKLSNASRNLIALKDRPIPYCQVGSLFKAVIASKTNFCKEFKSTVLEPSHFSFLKEITS